MKKGKLILNLFFTMLKIGFFTFGGGYGMIALLESELVEKKKWIEKDEFVDMIAIAESTPGPIAVNASTYFSVFALYCSYFYYETLNVHHRKPPLPTLSLPNLSP